jgi:hypothetical protein
MIAVTAASAGGTVVAIVVVEDGAVVGAGVAEATGIIADNKVGGICRRRSTHRPRASGIRGATITAGKAIVTGDCPVQASVATTISCYRVNP